MERTVTANVDASADQVMEALLDLDHYGEWIDVVRRVESAEPAEGDDGPAWWVTLRAAVGPLARNKRLRVVRTVDPSRGGDGGGDNQGGGTVTYRRREIDDRDHAAWEMQSSAAPAESGTAVTVRLAYGGSLWSGLLDGVLDRAIDAAIAKLGSRLSSEA